MLPVSQHCELPPELCALPCESPSDTVCHALGVALVGADASRTAPGVTAEPPGPHGARRPSLSLFSRAPQAPRTVPGAQACLVNTCRTSQRMKKSCRERIRLTPPSTFSRRSPGTRRSAEWLWVPPVGAKLLVLRVCSPASGDRARGVSVAQAGCVHER